MTPEELNRTIEFVVESQEAFDRRRDGLTEIQVRLLETKTARLDAYPKECSEARKRYEVSQAKSRESRKEFREFRNEFHASEASSTSSARNFSTGYAACAPRLTDSWTSSQTD
jgi:hypothetical protein